jgi:hypothetical protein
MTMLDTTLIPAIDGPQTVIPSATGMREKWTGAMLDQTGRAYCGAIRLDFSPSCVAKQVHCAIADTLSRHPILAAKFDIEADELVGYAPEEAQLREVLLKHLAVEHKSMTDGVFLSYRAKQANIPGLRLASVTDDTGIHVWVGFWIFTCDGASIDLLMQDIVESYNGKTSVSSQCWSEYIKLKSTYSNTPLVSEQERLSAYPAPGPYGLDAIRKPGASTSLKMQSIHFNTSVPRNTLLACAKAYRVTPFVLMFGAFQRAVCALSKVKTVVTGVPFSNRLENDDLNVVGPLSITVPVTTKHRLNEGITAELKELQRSVLSAASRQQIEPSYLYPQGISPRTAAYVLPFPQLFNAWNSKSDGKTMSLSKTESLTMKLLPNDTCRVGFEITLDDNSENISGRIDMDLNLYDGLAESVIKHITDELNEICEKYHHETLEALLDG